jgi:hypothetical protein
MSKKNEQEVENDMMFKDSVLRIVVGDYPTSVCLFDVIDFYL